MKRLLNTLFVMTQNAYLKKDGETVVVRVGRETRLRVPIITIGSIVCFGDVMMSPSLMGFCAMRGVTISYLSFYGRFLARIQGPVSGNVLLRKEQYRFSDDKVRSASVARTMIAAKIYFGVFNDLIVSQKADFSFTDRNRRPPLDRVNALLSFVYTMLYHDMRSALETVGLDPAVGFLHRDRPGRMSLALDIMEEMRPFLADRLVLSLINMKQVERKGFTISESGAVLMDDACRKTVVASYQKRKQDAVNHPYIGEDMHIGILLQTQAILLARFLRGDIDGYPAYIWR